METTVENENQTTDNKDTTLLPLEEQLGFRRRYRNSKLERLTIEQLKEKAGRLNLDIINFNHRWEFIDLLERTRHNQAIAEHSSSYRTYLNRLSFLDLPAEIRNQVYGYALTTENSIFTCSHHWQAKRLRSCSHPSRRSWVGYSQKWVMWGDGDVCFAALKLLKQLNKVIRAESISCYYANNKFIICEPILWNSVRGLYVDFLASIGEKARTHLRHLTINESIYRGTSEVDYKRFMQLLQQCQLEYLDVSIHPMWLLKGGPEAWRNTSREVSRADFDISNFVNNFRPLVKLQRMYLRIIVKWKCSYFINEEDELSKSIPKMLEKEELEKEFEVALPNVRLTIEISILE